MNLLKTQRILTHLGYNPGEQDGIDGPKTQKAVRDFQKDVGIEVDGIAGPVTWGHLIEAYKGSHASAHFVMNEYQCDCEGMYCDGFEALMDEELLERVEALRQLLDNPVNITSGVRCHIRNAEVGGITGSKHKTGCAADLYSPGIHYTKVAAAARALGLGVIEYPAELFVHVEV